MVGFSQVATTNRIAQCRKALLSMNQRSSMNKGCRNLEDGGRSGPFGRAFYGGGKADVQQWISFG